MRETESLFIAAQKDATRTNYIKAKINNKQQNSKCRLCRNRDETVNHIIRQRMKRAQKKNKSRYDWLGKVIHGKFCKRLKFDQTTKW